MAEPEQSQSSEASFFEHARAVVEATYRAAFRDGTLDAAGRQGVDELANAFGQAWPDNAITVQEPGGIWNPLHSELTDQRREAEAATSPEPTPSEIAGIKPAGQDRGGVHGPEERDEEYQTAAIRWTRRIGGQRERPDSDDYQRARGKSLADDQKEQKEQDRLDGRKQAEELKHEEKKENDRGGRGGRGR